MRVQTAHTRIDQIVNPAEVILVIVRVDEDVDLRHPRLPHHCLDPWTVAVLSRVD